MDNKINDLQVSNRLVYNDERWCVGTIEKNKRIEIPTLARGNKREREKKTKASTAEALDSTLANRWRVLNTAFIPQRI